MMCDENYSMKMYLNILVEMKRLRKNLRDFF